MIWNTSLIMQTDQIQITWYGRCCFLVTIGGQKVLFDPYDTYCGVDIGRIDADILLSSSTWHDHGHIGASPHAYIYTYPGRYENSGLVITGIEAKENRGTPTVIFNVVYENISITNFADFGPALDEDFNHLLSDSDRELLRSTNIAFIRPDIVGDEVKDYGVNIHNENALKYCNPALIFPEHYFPESFVNEQVAESEKEKFLRPNIVVNEMIDLFKYPLEEVDDYTVSISPSDLTSRRLYKFLKLHPQVKYRAD